MIIDTPDKLERLLRVLEKNEPIRINGPIPKLADEDFLRRMKEAWDAQHGQR